MQRLIVALTFLLPSIWAGVLFNHPCGVHEEVPRQFVQVRATPDPCQGDGCTAPVGTLKTIEADFSLIIGTTGVRFRVDRGFDLVAEGDIDFAVEPGQFYSLIFYYNPPLDHLGSGRYYISLYDRYLDSNWVCSRIYMNVTSPP